MSIAVFSKPRNILYLLLGVAILIIVLHVLTQYLILTQGYSEQVIDVLQKFNVDEEVSLPTWYAQTLLLFVGLAALPIARNAWKKQSRFRYHWWGIAIGMVYLSMDEGAALHELLIEPMQVWLDIDSGPLFFAWVIPVTIAVGTLGLLYAHFWWKLPVAVRTAFLVAVIIFLLGALGMEMVSGDYWQANEFENTFRYRIFNAIEEGLEFIGVSIALYGMLLYKNQLHDKTT